MIISAPNHEPGECWAARHRAHIAEADARRAAERDSQRRSSVLRAARVVDVYHDSGVRERFIYRVTESLTDGCLDAVRLQRGRVEVAVVSVASAEQLHTRAWPLIREALGADLERFSAGCAARLCAGEWQGASSGCGRQRRRRRPPGMTDRPARD